MLDFHPSHELLPVLAVELRVRGLPRRADFGVEFRAIERQHDVARAIFGREHGRQVFAELFLCDFNSEVFKTRTSW